MDTFPPHFFCSYTRFANKFLLSTKCPPFFVFSACRHEIPKLAVVKVYISSTVATVSTISLRATFVDKVANFGKHFGEFK